MAQEQDRVIHRIDIVLNAFANEVETTWLSCVFAGGKKIASLFREVIER